MTKPKPVRQTVGRKRNSESAAEARHKLHEAAPAAAAYISKVASGKAKRPGAIRLEACRYVYDQVNGKPKLRQEITTPADAVDYNALVKSATEALKQAKQDGVDIGAQADAILSAAHQQDDKDQETAGKTAGITDKTGGNTGAEDAEDAENAGPVVNNNL